MPSNAISTVYNSFSRSSIWNLVVLFNAKMVGPITINYGMLVHVEKKTDVLWLSVSSFWNFIVFAVYNLSIGMTYVSLNVLAFMLSFSVKQSQLLIVFVGGNDLCSRARFVQISSPFCLSRLATKPRTVGAGATTHWHIASSSRQVQRANHRPVRRGSQGHPRLCWGHDHWHSSHLGLPRRVDESDGAGRWRHYDELPSTGVRAIASMR